MYCHRHVLFAAADAKIPAYGGQPQALRTTDGRNRRELRKTRVEVVEGRLLNGDEYSTMRQMMQIQETINNLCMLC